MSTTKKATKKKVVESTSNANRREVYIRVSDIPEAMFQKIEADAKDEGRSNGAEVLAFLKKKNYKNYKD